MSTDLTHIPKRIKLLREAAKMPQHELARMAGLTQAQISAYEVGRAFPGLESTIKLAQVLGVSVSDLLGETAPKTAPPRPPTRAEMALWVLEAMQFARPVIERVRLVLKDGSI